MTGRRRLAPFVVLGVVLALIVAVVLWLTTGGTKMKTITAQFVEAPGLYPGNHVDVLGIPVGTVISIKSNPNYVSVKLHVKDNIQIPSGAIAELIAPTVVADRAVELYPPYAGSGPTLSNGAVIPPNRTITPQSIDAEIRDLNTLAYQLGPNGLNKKGQLTDLLHKVAVQFNGTGPQFHGTVVNFSAALHGLAQSAPQIGSLFTNAGNLSQALAGNSTAYAALTNELASVGGLLANDRKDVAGVLSNLQQLFANLTSFLQADGSKLGGSIQNLNTFAGAIAKQQTTLAKLFDLTPLTLQNLNSTIDLSAPGGPALRGRYDAMPDTAQLVNQVCGNPTLRFLVVLATATQTNPLTPGTPQDTLCAVGSVVTAITPPPGAAPGPDLSLRALVP